MTSSPADKVAVVTGSSTGIGYETSLILARYLAGSDVETWLGGKRKVADEEFYKMMKQNMIM